MADDPQDLLRLADEVAAATGPDTVLDAAIWVHLPEQAAHAWKHGGDKFKHARQIAGCAFVPLYTASIDAAMTLVPAHDVGWRMDWSGRRAIVRIGFGGFPETIEAWAATPALALCAAALRARAHSTKDTSNVG